MSRSVPAHHMPYPELVEPRPRPVPYAIVDTTGKSWLPTNGMTSLRERKLLVPLVEGARSVARHEIAHVKWSPPRLPRVAFDLRYLMAIEDARVNLALVRVGLPVALTPAELTSVVRLARHDLTDGDVLAFALRSFAAQGTNAEQRILCELATEREAVRDLLVAQVRRVRIAILRAARARNRAAAPFRVVHDLARELARTLPAELARLGVRDRLPFPLELGGAGCCLVAGSGDGCGPAVGGRRPGAGSEGELRAGTLKVVVAALAHAAPGTRGARRGRGRATSEGDLPRHLHRWHVDRAVFRRRSRVRGGTVLVDTSGSMALDAAQVDRILGATAGAALIAIYSGNGAVGELRVIARDGRRADPRELVPFGRGNVVDEPALAWLTRQAEPRVWLSDGGVTGVGDATCPALTQRCKELVQRGKIRRVRTVEEAAAWLARGGGHAGVA